VCGRGVPLVPRGGRRRRGGEPAYNGRDPIRGGNPAGNTLLTAVGTGDSPRESEARST
jgi:hypothetical protein